MSDSPKIVFANQSCILAVGGQRVQVRRGDPWDAGDPAVKQYPDHFVDQVPAVRCTTETRGYRLLAEEPAVERATAAPGEKRTTPARRGGKATAGD
jgi:hypothetical protein